MPLNKEDLIDKLNNIPQAAGNKFDRIFKLFKTMAAHNIELEKRIETLEKRIKG